MILRFDHDKKKVFVVLKSIDYIDKLKQMEENKNADIFTHEYCSFMIESKSINTYSEDFRMFITILDDMKKRRQVVIIFSYHECMVPKCKMSCTLLRVIVLF